LYIAQKGSFAATTVGAAAVDAAGVDAELAAGGVDWEQPRKKTVRVRAETAYNVRNMDMAKPPVDARGP
jgi:hypothetical protein